MDYIEDMDDINNEMNTMNDILCFSSSEDNDEHNNILNNAHTLHNINTIDTIDTIDIDDFLIINKPSSINISSIHNINATDATYATDATDAFTNIFINTKKKPVKKIDKLDKLDKTPDKAPIPIPTPTPIPTPLDIDNKFIFNDETIAYYTQDKNITTKTICIKKSPFKNDTILLCLLFKEKIMTDYKCSISKCKVGKTWMNKPIQLLINRKNSKLEDLTIPNLELMCPNCFIIQYGIILFQKIILQTIYKCKLCNYPLYKFSNFKKKAGYCSACETKLITSSYYSKQNDYISELKNTLDTPSLASNASMTQDINNFDTSTSTYFNEVSQYKTFNKVSRKSKTPTNTSAHLTPVNYINNIVLNMSLPEIDYD